MDKILKLYTYVDGINDVPFFEDAPIEITDFKYNAARNGNLPILSATLYHTQCLDKLWNYKQYVLFRGEKYWVSKLPSSSKSNTDSRYKHEIEFISERKILFNTYFYDIVDGNNSANFGNKYCAHSANFVFYGTIKELIARINASLKYSGISYEVVLDDDVLNEKVTTSKEFSGNNLFLIDALNQAYEVYDIPYYFVGKTIHFGYYSTYIANEVLEYGVEKSLISIKRTNANERLITRATGVGSDVNIPYYYPNDSEKGNISFSIYDADGYDVTNAFRIVDKNKMARNLVNGVYYTYKKSNKDAVINPKEIVVVKWEHNTITGTMGEEVEVKVEEDTIEVKFDDANGQQNNGIKHDFRIEFEILEAKAKVGLGFELESDDYGHFSLRDCDVVYLINDSTGEIIQKWLAPKTNELESVDFLDKGKYYFWIKNVNVSRVYPLALEYTYKISSANVYVSQQYEPEYDWVGSNGQIIHSLYSIGVASNNSPTFLDYQFVMHVMGLVPFQSKLMPSIYSRGSAFNQKVLASSAGYERFYDARNNTYQIAGDYLEFANPLNDYNKSEKIYTYDNIKPELKDITNRSGQIIGQIIGVAYDDNDSDAIQDDGTNAKYLHPYFYVKLRLFNGYYAFNLFDHAIESDDMTFQFTSGNLNGCKCKVQGVKRITSDGFRFFNPVQVSGGNITKIRLM